MTAWLDGSIAVYRHLFAAIALGLLVSPAVAPAADDPPPLAREFRGVWVATVGNIDWPSKPGLPADVQKRELLAILDKAASLHLNAVILQVRPACDALYESKLEPWSGYLSGTAGKPPEPGYDPLAFAVAEAHARGLELHAWFNPYRARHPSLKGTLPTDHVVNRRPDLAKPYGKHAWLNPTHPDVADHSMAVVLDVVKRYDIDGVHLDDYFYPYKEKDAAGQVIPFPDDDTWAAYQKAGGQLARDDWRRDAVNRFVARLYKEVKAAKPWVKVGISPFGIWQPGHPAGVAGFNQYAELYADAKRWLNEGWVDYFTPQLYWPIAAEKQSFPKLLDWWAGENTKHRHLWPGLYTSRVTGAAKGWRATEVVEQVKLCRAGHGADGAVHFSMKALLRDTGGVTDALGAVYATPALVPASPWLASGAAPSAPIVSRDGDSVRVTTAPGARFVVVRSTTNGTWSSAIRGANPDGQTVVPVPAGLGRVVVSVVDRTGRESPSAIPR